MNTERGSQRYTFYCGYIGCHGQHLRAGEDCERGIASPVFARDYPKQRPKAPWTFWQKLSVYGIALTLLGLGWAWYQLLK